MNKADLTPRLWQMIIPAASALVVALIGLGSAIYQTDKPIQLTAVALTAQAAAQSAPALPQAAAPGATSTVPAPAQASPQAPARDAPQTPASAAPGPGVLVANRLALAVKLYLNGAYQLTLEPGGLESLPLPPGSAQADLRWSAVRLTGTGGAPLGGELGSTFHSLKAGDELAIVSQDGEQPYFYPIVSNTSSKDCKVTVDEGWTSEFATGIVIPARQEGVALGYYPLYSYSNVTLECGGQFYWWGLRPKEKNQVSIYYQVPKDTGVIEFTMK
jgi:hypothetical protein